jgi:hypothetical protein
MGAQTSCVPWRRLVVNLPRARTMVPGPAVPGLAVRRHAWTRAPTRPIAADAVMTASAIASSRWDGGTPLWRSARTIVARSWNSSAAVGWATGKGKPLHGLRQLGASNARRDCYATITTSNGSENKRAQSPSSVKLGTPGVRLNMEKEGVDPLENCPIVGAEARGSDLVGRGHASASTTSAGAVLQNPVVVERLSSEKVRDFLSFVPSEAARTVKPWTEKKFFVTSTRVWHTPSWWTWWRFARPPAM